jgi:hypothetical protein
MSSKKPAKKTAKEAAKETVDEAIAAEEKKKAKLADVLVRRAREETSTLFRSGDGQTWADMRVNGHRETWAIKSRDFRRWLFLIYTKAMGETPSGEVVGRAVEMLDAVAALEGDTCNVHVRVGELDGITYIDMCDSEWRAIEVSAGGGWRIIDEPPIRFRRAPAMLPLPEPVPGGSIDTLRKYINVKNESDFVLVVSWLLAALRARGPYTILCFYGEHGSAKTTAAKVLRRLVDPNQLPVRCPPKEERDLFVTAGNSHVFTLENVSSLRDWLSDALCTLSTEGAFATRMLYTDNEEQLFWALRPIIATGITVVVERPDLTDRTILMGLEIIAEDRRRAEDEFWATFDKDAPEILGALLDAVAHGLKILPDLRVERLPRMADFAKWAMACEGALWPRGTFMAAYSSNILSAVEESLASDAVASAVRQLMLGRTEWHGQAKALLAELTELVGERISKGRDWPQSPRKLTSSLQVAATFLRRVGIVVAWAAKHAETGGRSITITVTPTAKGKENTHRTHRTHSDQEKSKSANGLGAGDMAVGVAVDVAGATLHPQPAVDVGGGRPGPTATSTGNNPLKNKALVGGVDVGGVVPTLRGSGAGGGPEPECARCGIGANAWGALIPCGRNGSAGLYHQRCWTEERTKGPVRKRPAAPPADAS